VFLNFFSSQGLGSFDGRGLEIDTGIIGSNKQVLFLWEIQQQFAMDVDGNDKRKGGGGETLES
jgi:hypothetical protein